MSRLADVISSLTRSVGTPAVAATCAIPPRPPLPRQAAVVAAARVEATRVVGAATASGAAATAARGCLRRTRSSRAAGHARSICIRRTTARPRAQRLAAEDAVAGDGRPARAVSVDELGMGAQARAVSVDGPRRVGEAHHRVVARRCRRRHGGRRGRRLEDSCRKQWRCVSAFDGADGGGGDGGGSVALAVGGADAAHRLGQSVQSVPEGQLA
eukprot:4232143-Prymnesium_polylepis.2